MSAIELTDAQLDALADRIAAKLAALQFEQPRLVTADELARHLGVSVGYVREHAKELGVVRIGCGKKPRLRFPADAAMPQQPASTPTPRPRSNRKATARQAGSVLAIRR